VEEYNDGVVVDNGESEKVIADESETANTIDETPIVSRLNLFWKWGLVSDSLTKRPDPLDKINWGAGDYITPSVEKMDSDGSEDFLDLRIERYNLYL